MNLNPIYSFLTLLFFISVYSNEVFAQEEQLGPMLSNPVLQRYSRTVHPAHFRIAATDTIDLPLLDDFSEPGPYPNTDRWADRSVYVNRTFHRNAYTYGVATFDGLNESGDAYDQTNASAFGPCDTLTSRFIKLLTKPASAGGGVYSLSDSITLSFYYQLKGYGDAPENSDSLVVEYFKPSTGQWSRQWFTLGGVSAGNDTVFRRVDLRLLDASFLEDGFRFRFRNFAARTGNLDHFHIDYVRFYQAKNIAGQMDTSLIDVAYTVDEASFLVNHTAIPWEHYLSLTPTQIDNLLIDSNKVYYRVNDVVNQDVGFNTRVYDFNGALIWSYGLTNGNIFPQRPKNVNLTYTHEVNSLFPFTPFLLPDTNYFTVRTFFSNGNSYAGLKSNDTITYIQRFENFYSYDDGSAEAGYDLVNSPNGQLAMQFEILKPDTLRAVRFHFVQQNLNVTNKLFILKVWTSLNPEVVLYQENNQRPVLIDTINGFATYVLDQIVPVSGTIYVGFEQIAPDGLHLGFDRNTASNPRMFYNVNGTWNTVGVAPGSFMIRPVMGDSLLFTGLPYLTKSEKSFSVWPNPASSSIFIDPGVISNPLYLELLDIEGRVCVRKAYESRMDVDSFDAGMYFLRIIDANGSVYTQRLLIQ